MALQASGSISFSQIANEFGEPPGKNLGAYRISQSVGTLSGLPLDAEIPQSGSISFGNFLGKRLNMVVDFYSLQENIVRRNARTRYINNASNVIIIGGFKTTRPLVSSGTKVYINVNVTIGSDKGGRNNVALRTGSWDSDTQLITVIGPNGRLRGAGGDGGAGAGDNNGTNGTNGSSALGIDYSSTVTTQSGAVIRAGRGGGGGGGSGSGVEFSNIQSCNGRSNESPRIGGGGGAGGSGFPAGTGGLGSEYISRLSNKQGGATTFAGNGTNGTTTVDGQGGSGGVATPQTFGQCGSTQAFSGAGGGSQQSGQSGTKPYRSAGGAGQSGYAIIVASGAALSGSPTIDGNILNPGTVDGN